MTPVDREEALESVGPGWASLINELYDALPQGVMVVQVKEKFGGLRFYTEPFDLIFSATVYEAEVRSLEICEECGEPGSPKTNSTYWIKTLCAKHKAERE